MKGTFSSLSPQNVGRSTATAIYEDVHASHGSKMSSFGLLWCVFSIKGLWCVVTMLCWSDRNEMKNRIIIPCIEIVKVACEHL